MAKHKSIRRYTLEIEKIRNSEYPSFDDIKYYIEDHGFYIGDRTIQRDIQQIRYEFGIEIKYDRYENGYYIDFKNSINTESFFRFLEIVNTAELLTDSLNESKDILKYISFDAEGSFNGNENIKPLLSAIKDHRKISFEHYNFHTNKIKKYSVKPYLLKEYQNRWYLIGLVGNTKELRTFGLDRISNLIVKAETFKPDKKINPKKRFEDTIGLVYSYETVQKVVLSFTPVQGNYIKTLPMHISQEILIDNDEECRISLYVIPNYELNQEILKHGNTVKVLEPKWLADEIKSILKDALGQY